MLPGPSVVGSTLPARAQVLLTPQSVATLCSPLGSRRRVTAPGGHLVCRRSPCSHRSPWKEPPHHLLADPPHSRTTLRRVDPRGFALYSSLQLHTGSEPFPRSQTLEEAEHCPVASLLSAHPRNHLMFSMVLGDTEGRAALPTHRGEPRTPGARSLCRSHTPGKNQGPFLPLAGRRASSSATGRASLQPWVLPGPGAGVTGGADSRPTKSGALEWGQALGLLFSPR